MAWPSRRRHSPPPSVRCCTEAEYWNLHCGAIASANFEGAWAYATGKGVLVGIVDEGVNYTHLDLAGQLCDRSRLRSARRHLGVRTQCPTISPSSTAPEVAGIIAGSHRQHDRHDRRGPRCDDHGVLYALWIQRRHGRVGRRPVAASPIRRRQQQLGIHLGILRQFPRRIFLRVCRAARECRDRRARRARHGHRGRRRQRQVEHRRREPRRRRQLPQFLELALRRRCRRHDAAGATRPSSPARAPTS